MSLKDIRLMNQLGKEFTKVLDDKKNIIDKQKVIENKALEAIAEVALIEDTSEAMKKINLCVVTYWINTLIFLRDYEITATLMTVIATEKKRLI